MARYFKDRFKKDSTNPLTVNRSLSEEFKKVPYLTILLSIVQILMFVVSIAIGGLESVIVNPFIGPPEDTMILWEQKKASSSFLQTGKCIDLKALGILYVGFIYFMSALGGNLLSALFLPHITTIGASSALFGILGAIYADLWMNWRFMPQPKKDFVLLTFQVVAQIIVGLIPWIDNFAHCGGLLVGFLTTLLTIPRMRDLNPYEESINGGSVNTQVKRKKLSGASNHLSNDPNSQLETIDLESGSSQTKSHTQSAILRFMKKFACGCSACFCCCFYCFTKKGRAKGKFRLWLRVIAGCLLFLYFAVFGGLYFSQLDFNLLKFNTFTLADDESHTNALFCELETATPSGFLKVSHFHKRNFLTREIKKQRVFSDEDLANSLLHERKILFSGEKFVDTEQEPSLMKKVLMAMKQSQQSSSSLVQAEEELADVVERFENVAAPLIDKDRPVEIYVQVKSPVPSGFAKFLQSYFESKSEVHYHPHNSFVVVAPSMRKIIEKLRHIDMNRIKKEFKSEDDKKAENIVWVGIVDPSYKISTDLHRNKKNPLASLDLDIQLFYKTELPRLIKDGKTRLQSSLNNDLLKALASSPAVRHIQKEEKFGLENDYFDDEEDFEDENDEEQESDLISFSSFFNKYLTGHSVENKQLEQEQSDADQAEVAAAKKLLNDDYTLDDHETFHLISALNPLSDTYKSVLLKYGTPDKTTSKSYLGDNFARIANTTLNFVGSDKIGQSALPDVAWMWSKGFTGKGQVIGIGDTGIDTHNCCFYRRGQKVPYNKIDLEAHDKFTSYKVYADDKDIVRGHGSFVSSILACNVKPDQFANGDEMKDLYDGIVKDAKLCFFDLGLPTHRLNVPRDLSGIYFPHMHNKCDAKISTNSWGSPKGARYTIATQEVDEWAYKNPNTVQLFAAGNSGRSGTRTITSPGTCKNCITVGSSQWTRKSFQLGYPLYGDIIRHEMMEAQMCHKNGAGKLLFATPSFCKSIGAKQAPCFDQRKSFCTKMDTYGEKVACSSNFFKNVCCAKKYLMDMIEHPEHFSPNNMGTFSSRGPTRGDNRIKPDIVAPGQLIFGSRSLGTSSLADSEELADASIDKGYCPVPIANQGTSFSTPIVAGYASMIHQYFSKGFYPEGKENSKHSLNPMGATLKAMLVNSGQELNGLVETNGHGIWKQLHATPSYTQGFGLVRLRHVLPFAGESDFTLFVSQDDSVATSEYKQYCFRTVKIESKKDHAFKELNQTLKATLVWTDYPGSPNAKIQLVNNLDLVVQDEATKTEYFGNGGRDYVNNVEQVNIKGFNTDGRQYRVVVQGTNVPHGPQQFSLIVNGPLEKIECTGEPNLKNARIVKKAPAASNSNDNEPELLSGFLKLFSGQQDSILQIMSWNNKLL
ncbi:hypothetical protein C9374_002106 [Naegleria lovaniensis]|uniref:Peptidase S8/S53 domain-containing protein n=1 Tax=Naegleria lovaniensis TaxID=51637 RepID=A0AA88KN13_NAELO|nr:uncharacterized protein C9374_002106 [Naegleria lovaniensis]KAG2387071.1 hypothetical protein C9374_002106 [Naegleria lovaniensis]